MQKKLKFILIFISVVFGIVCLDTITALVFNNSPLLKIREKLSDDSYVDKGLVINTYNCNNKKKTLFKWVKYSCPVTPTIQYKKVALNDNISLNIPPTWEITNPNKEEFNIYPNSDNKNSYIYIKMDKNIGVCGTGVTFEEFILNNGKKATIAYSNQTNHWEWVIINVEDKDILFANHGLSNQDLEPSIEIIKDITLARLYTKNIYQQEAHFYNFFNFFLTNVLL